MKLKIKVKVLTQGCMPKIIKGGEWIDLKAATDMVLPAPQSGTLKRDNKTEEGYRDVTMEVNYIPLGVAMKLPEGFEAILAPRSSTPSKFKLMIPNSFGVIDNSYSGNNDEWKLVCTTMKKATIHRGDRVCQFRIQPSQKATVWQKLKWIFSNGIELVEVDNLEGPDRGGFGSTGVQ